MIHDEHTMTLERMNRMMLKGNTRLMLKRGWLPRFVIRRYYVRLMKYFDDMFGDDSDKQFKDQTIRTAMWNKIHNILKPMHILLATDKSELAEGRFKHYWGRDFAGIEDLELVRNEIEKLSKRFQIMFNKKKDDDVDDSVTFENVIQGVEITLEMGFIPRNTTTLYQFRGMLDTSHKIIRQRNSSKHGKH